MSRLFQPTNDQDVLEPDGKCANVAEGEKTTDHIDISSYSRQRPPQIRCNAYNAHAWHAAEITKWESTCHLHDLYVLEAYRHRTCIEDDCFPCRTDVYRKMGCAVLHSWLSLNAYQSAIRDQVL